MLHAYLNPIQLSTDVIKIIKCIKKLKRINSVPHYFIDF